MHPYRPADYLDLYDFRLRVRAMYDSRNQALARQADPEQVWSEFRAARDELFRGHARSALSARDRRTFTQLHYFPYNPGAVVVSELVPHEEPGEIEVHTGAGQPILLRRAAALHFELNGEPRTLTVFWIDVYGGGLFLPFRDRTAGSETYGGGRYLFDTVKGSDFQQVGAGRIVLDFNYAYNPSCAYDSRWVCPLAPRENNLPVALRAGERNYEPR